MRLFRRAFWIALLPLLFSAEVRADYCCPQYYDDGCYNDCCDWCSDWTVYGDYLYWRARRCQLDYVITTSLALANRDGNIKSVEPSYDSGFRVGAVKECGKRFFGIEYTYFRNQESDKSVGATFTGTRSVANAPNSFQSNVAFAKADWKIDYDVVDLIAGYTIRSRNCFDAYVFGGFRYASIDQELKTLYSGSQDSSGPAQRIRQEIDMDAYGVDLGIGANYAFCGCFNLFGRFSYDALIADFERKYVYDTRGNSGGFANFVNFSDDCWYLIGAINLALGVGFDYDLCGCWVDTIGIAVGYEFHQWLNQPDFIDFSANGAQINFERHLQSLGFDGLFVRLSLGF